MNPTSRARSGRSKNPSSAGNSIVNALLLNLTAKKVKKYEAVVPTRPIKRISLYFLHLFIIIEFSPAPINPETKNPLAIVTANVY